MFIPQIEKKTKAEIKQYQELRLVESLQYLSAKSKFYKRFFNENKIDINKIKTLKTVSPGKTRECQHIDIIQH